MVSPLLHGNSRFKHVSVIVHNIFAYFVREVKEFRVSSLSSSAAAQVCHDDRVVELKEQLEVEEADGDRQEEKVEVEKEKSNQRECAMWMTMDECECAQNLSHGM